jgi:adenylate cyclase
VALKPDARVREPEGERKHVTVLFTDVVDSMGLERELDDPEQMHDLMDGLFGATCEIVERFGGTVQRFTGDGAMVLFGAPVAHEDHAVRACRAAVELLGRVRSSSGLPLRIGLNSGEVVTGTVGIGGSAEYTAFGPTVGLAKRAESRAAPGTVALTEATARLLRGRAELRDVGTSAAGRMYELGSIDEHWADPAAAPIFGRDRELAVLLDARGRGEPVTVFGEPGIGKSRLCEELIARCRRAGSQVEIVRGVSHGGPVPLLPFVESLRERLSLASAADGAEARERLGERLARAPEAANDRALLEDLLGIADPGTPRTRVDPAARRRRLFRAIPELIFGGDTTSRVLVVEDLHWLDRSSVELVRALAPDPRTFVVATARPEPGIEPIGRTTLTLGPLPDKPCDALVRHLLGDDPATDSTRHAVMERCGGYPLFVREVVRAIAEEGHDAPLDLPPSVQAVLAARVDRLPSAQKSILQVTAVAGAGAGEAVLRTVTGADEPSFAAGLRGLIARDLIRAAREGYATSHALVEEVTYGALLGATRRRLHRAVALALEEHDPDRVDERAAILAMHWERAAEPVRAAAMHMRAGMRTAFTDPARALLDHQRAAELADPEGTGTEAMNVRIQARAMALLAAFRAGVPEGQSKERFAEEMGRIHAEGLSLAEATDQSAAAAVLAASYANLERSLGATPARTIPLAREAQRRAVASGDRGLQMAVSTAVVMVYWSAGRTREGLEVIDRYLEIMGDDYELGAGLAVVSPYAYLLQFRGMCLVTLGDVREGRRHFELGLQTAEAAGDLDTQMLGHNNLVSLADHDWLTDGVLAHAKRNRELSEQAGNALGVALSYRALCCAYQHLGEHDEAVEAGRFAMDTLTARGTVGDNEAFVAATLATAYLDRGDLDEADAVARRALQAALASDARGYPEIRARTVMARVLVARGGAHALVAARGELDVVEARIEEGRHLVFAPGLWEARAELERANGADRVADEALVRAAELAARIGAPKRAGLLRERAGAAPAGRKGP